jgi:hypothetical protein
LFLNIYLHFFKFQQPNKKSNTFLIIHVLVNEDALPGTVVVEVSVTDSDNESDNVEFHIIAGDPHAQFAVRTTGEVYVSRSLDRETISRYQLTVLATDGKFVTATALQVDILDANGMDNFLF